MRTMGLDVGSRTVGIAISDPFGWTAQGIETIRINEDEENYGISRVMELVQEYEVSKFVVGLPKNMDNSIGPRAEASMRYAELLKKQIDLPVIFQDERLTTVQAERMLIEQANTSREKRKKVIDKVAAVMILQNYLDGNPN
ncbi:MULTISPECIES: Holliday junction resolvase RuvX [Carnobacterium]|nr:MULTISPECIES: Holliday junction resolvase RuvX [Carnobacterium]AOA01741.1 Holliday junction DNA helicase RuvA [Carnobacterium maltaromaticum]MBC9786848.1 Holliday junction resolvase RuvX [Carnobacterium maltaromaticum]MBC9808694.1 Holliday junction resolvase RuvX [Carnobacterium maltaromaticum]MBQ6485101.1 Holliday junction resolvase RuvX [Carnobacterium sp.]MCC4311854.1 Holliday junction resolvase [Carnobacterium maltaromaticum]